MCVFKYSAKAHIMQTQYSLTALDVGVLGGLKKASQAGCFGWWMVPDGVVGSVVSRYWMHVGNVLAVRVHHARNISDALVTF